MIGEVLFRISKIQIFESNSQQLFNCDNLDLSCSEYQRYKFLKAIHNPYKSNRKSIPLFRISKIQIFESNSQRIGAFFQTVRSCSEYQRYKFLKAIHNFFAKHFAGNNVVQNIKDTNF